MAIDLVLTSGHRYNGFEEEEEEYIDMEINMYESFLWNSNPTEFEFQMFSSSSDREMTTTSPADELFYEGKLLPLHLPPRFQMVKNLLQDKNKATVNEFFATPIENTPNGSCNVSPSVSCQVSRELSPEEYFLDNTAEDPKKSWIRKLNLTKQTSIGLKIKASRDYLKSLFGKTSGSDESRSRIPRASAKKKEKLDGNNGGHCHRRSFAGAIKRFSTTNTSSGPSSFSCSSSSNTSKELQVHHRSVGTSSVIENQIQSAIAHCKRSQEKLDSRKSVSDMGFCSLAASRIVCDGEERQVLCRG